MAVGGSDGSGGGGVIQEAWRRWSEEGRGGEMGRQGCGDGGMMKEVDKEMWRLTEGKCY